MADYEAEKADMRRVKAALLVVGTHIHTYNIIRIYIHTYITNSESSQSSVSWEYETLLQRLMDLKNERDELQKNLRSYTYTHIYTYIHTYTYAGRISVMDSTELACMT